MENKITTRKVTVRVWSTKKPEELIIKGVPVNKTKNGLYYFDGIINPDTSDSIEELVLFIKRNESRNVPVMLFGSDGRRIDNYRSSKNSFWFSSKIIEVLSDEEDYECLKTSENKPLQSDLKEDNKNNNEDIKQLLKAFISLLNKYL